MRRACSVGVAGEKERGVGRGWVREAAARGDIMMGTTAQLEHSFERLVLRAHHGRHASARMSEKSAAARPRARVCDGRQRSGWHCSAAARRRKEQARDGVREGCERLQSAASRPAT